MQVIATAGHVDHGKSTLVRALTGMEPDRLEEERRRGLTIELGYAWTSLPSGEQVAFVDVPGHERFLATTLAGVGPVPAALFVVAADEGWMPQSEEHLVALEALGVRHGVLAVTRADLADPGPAREEALARLRRGPQADAEAVAVSGRTGAGLPALAAALDRLVAALPPPDPDAPVRLWVDRAFTVRGSGTVLTGTLPAGRIAVGDTLLLDGEEVRVRGLQSLKRDVTQAVGVARVAVNVRGSGAAAQAARGAALTSPGAWARTAALDVRLVPAARADPASVPSRLVAHIGSAAVPCSLRPLGAPGPQGERHARLRLDRELPLHVGDVLLLRDPGRARGDTAAGRVRVLFAATALDVRPAPLPRRRGAARARGEELAKAAEPGAGPLLRAHGFLSAADLRAMGVPAPGEPVAGGWHADPALWRALPARLAEAARAYAAAHPLDPGMPVEAARRALGLPDRRLVPALVRPPLALEGGRLTLGGSPGPPPRVAEAVRRLHAELAPFEAPEAGTLAALGLGPREVAAAVRAGALLRLGGGVVLLPGADERAAAVLRRLPQPFTVSQARQALHTTRRVAVPLLEHLDARGLTRRLSEVLRQCPEVAGGAMPSGLPPPPRSAAWRSPPGSGTRP
ncbi:SelB C-terminal domain-containing protein [Thermocatellispora tengchongensis]|uniref:SelB domain-containing protein n=1 Tax=Thermocatellispora tengchongensis TaxID=1073253 RepID=UPI0031EA97CB